MTLFSTITKGMADGAETLQANFAKLAKAITSIGDDGTMTVPNLNVTNLEVTGTPKTVTNTTTVNGLVFTFTRVGTQVIVTTATSSTTSQIAIGSIANVIPVGFSPVAGIEAPYLQAVQTNNFVSLQPNRSMYFNSAISSGAKPRIVSSYPTTDVWPTD